MKRIRRMMKNRNRTPQRHLVNTRYAKPPEGQYKSTYTSNRMAVMLDDHPWTNNIREEFRMINGDEKLPCFTRSEDGALVTNCDECRRMLVLRRNYQDNLLKEKHEKESNHKNMLGL